MPSTHHISFFALLFLLSAASASFLDPSDLEETQSLRRYYYRSRGKDGFSPPDGGSRGNLNFSPVGMVIFGSVFIITLACGIYCKIQCAKLEQEERMRERQERLLNQNGFYH
ncbi:hypothetical protein FGO68_gene3944 [Halteria grandinella]|uniref:Transmembrane protein n=1 Tax=Halteria grandinella TaxID=5974 RepID=A0A8J8NHG6_HALGN|nr:hypothetical protein FGO68_gene3944 [Halteria grandinella]